MDKNELQINDKAQPRRRPGPLPGEKKLKKLALDSIIEMVKDDALKPADRLNAAKTLLDYLGKQADADGDGEVRIVFENLPEGYAD